MGRRKRASNAHGQAINTTPQWQSELSPSTLEELICERTLGGCGHSFAMHKNYTHSALNGKMYCLVCQVQVHEGRRHASKACVEFVNGLVKHMDHAKLLAAPLRTTKGEPVTKPTVPKAQTEAALELLRQAGLVAPTAKRKRT